MAARTGRALLAGVIGDPIAHSLSPAIHEYWLKSYGIDGSYVPLHVKGPRFTGMIEELRGLGFRGCNVTLPHKERAFALADWKDEAAEATGAVNTLVFSKEGIKGYNTDVSGFSENLKASLNPIDNYMDSCLVLGAGGAARGIIHALQLLGARQIFLSNRTHEKALKLAHELQSLKGEASSISCVPWEEKETVLKSVSLLINTTQLGMVGQPPLEINLDSLPNTAAVTDIVYKPLKTGLLEAGEARELRVADGLGMLLWQASPGFEMWFGKKPTVTAELRAMIEGLLG